MSDSTRERDITRRDLLAMGGAASAAAAIAGPLSPARLLAAGKVPQVPRRVLGKTGKKIPILLLGGAVGFDKRFDPKIAEALRYGVNYIDAADCYNGGSCEPAVASFHTRIKARKDLWITSKSDAHDPKGFETTLNTSLEKLKTDYVDMYYLHAFEDGSMLNAELRKVVERLKKQGKLRHFGFSCHDGNVAELLQLAAKTPWVDSVMFRYNFRKYGEAKLNGAIDAAHKAGVGLIAMKTQGSEASFKGAVERFRKQGKWTKHQAVLKAVWEDKRITAAVSHMDTFDKLRENVAAALDRTKLTAAERSALDAYAAATRSLACDGCDHYCNPAVGAPVRIGDTMRFLMYHDVYGEADKARALFQRMPPSARALAGVDFRGANRACPNGVDVAAHMKRALQVLS